MDLLDLHASSIALNEELWAGVTGERLDLATPCEGWTVRELMRHQVDMALKFTAGARGTTPGEPADDDPLTAYRAASAAAAGAFREPGFLDRAAEFPGYGTRRGRDLVAAHFVDNLVHAWDLGRALGFDPALDEELVGAAVRMARHYPTTPDVRGPGGAFAMPVAVPEDAPATDRLVGLLGRSPHWTAPAA
ncbi:TIGR03086 family metal-binding protein [Saccharothrix sp. Mg75]|uniref:TIGR03086 family metal-binding protein n=1 Tax=Saccharothrix sp. Mg75 TaxID=3445357 RepID=UPI003EEE4285